MHRSRSINTQLLPVFELSSSVRSCNPTGRPANRPSNLGTIRRRMSRTRRTARGDSLRVRVLHLVVCGNRRCRVCGLLHLLPRSRQFFPRVGLDGARFRSRHEDPVRRWRDLRRLHRPWPGLDLLAPRQAERQMSWSAAEIAHCAGNSLPSRQRPARAPGSVMRRGGAAPPPAPPPPTR